VRNRLQVRHATLSKDDYEIVINYVKKTGAIIDAGLVRDGRTITVTADPEVIKKWMGSV